MMGMASRTLVKPAPSSGKGVFQRPSLHLHVGADGVRFAIMSIDQIKPYDGDPRVADNPMQDDIKASIHARGLDSPLCVTHRPGDDLYMLQSGGNTRLRVLRELFDESGEDRFLHIPVLIRPWVSEVHALSGHLAENALRGNMCFADLSSAVMGIHSYLVEADGAMTWKAFEQRLTSMGFNISHAQLARMRFMEKYMNDLLPEPLRIQYGPHHVQKLMYALKGSSHLRPDKKDDLRAILTRHGMDIDACIIELTRPTARANINTREADDAMQDSDCSDSSSAVSAHSTGIAGPQATAHRLQRIMDLRKRSWIAVVASPASSCFEQSDKGFGVRIREKTTMSETPLSRLLAHIVSDPSDQEGCVLPIKLWMSINEADANTILGLLRNIHSISVIESRLPVSGQPLNIMDSTNEELARLRDDIFPALATELRLLKDYIRHDGTGPMILSLFPGIAIGQVKELKEELGMCSAGGRPIKAWPYEANQIWKAWRKHDGLEERRRYLATAKDTKLPLGTVWNSIKSRQHRRSASGMKIPTQGAQDEQRTK